MINPFQTIEELEEENGRLRSIISSAICNLSLYRCKACNHLSMQGWTCANCGKDPSMRA